MLQTKKNDLLIGFILSVLLSLFVNFALLMRRYEILSEHMPRHEPSPFENYQLYFSLFWFFLLAFVLFVLNKQMYKVGEKLFRKKEYKVILFASGVSIVSAFAIFVFHPIVHHLIISNLFQAEGYFPKPGPRMPHPLLTEHIFILLTVLLSALLIRLLNDKQEMALAYEKLKTEKLQNSYNALMGQINPHFFFNSLNGLNSLIRNGEKEQTLTYLDELSNVFRYILQSNKKELVTLAEELQFAKAYTYLLGVRYEGKLFFSIQADPPYLLWYLPILSVLPLIENAVKHNVISKQSALQIDIYTTKDDLLVVSNPIHPKMEDCASNGIGLKNLWGRYRMLTNKDIRISNRKDYFKVSLPLLNTPIQP